MTTTYWNLQGGDLAQDWSNTSLITADDVWSGVPSITGFRGDDLTTATGTDPRTIFGTSTVVDVNANRTDTGFTTGGVTEFEIANPVVALKGSGTADAPYLAIYLDSTGRQDVQVSFNLRDVEASANNSVQQVNVQYRVSETAAWTNVDGGYVPDATTGPNAATLVTPVSVTLPGDANDAAHLQVRVMTTNAPGNDEWVGVDDIRVTSQPSNNTVPGTLSIADASVAEGNSGQTPLAFTVSRVGGTAGAVDVHYSVALPGGQFGADASDFGAFQQGGTIHFDAGQASARLTLPVLGDTAPEFDQHFTVTLSDPTGGATIDRATATGTILNDDLLPLQVGQIQGASQFSPAAGQQVLTTGVVTAIDGNGFYLQDFGDGDSRTSDAVFVFTGTAPDVFVGDGLTVQGIVSEYRSNAATLPVTEITAPQITLDSTDNELPAAVLIGQGGVLPPTEATSSNGLSTYDPTRYGIDFYESLEGMRVTLDRPQVVANTNTDQFGETNLVVSDGEGATGINARGGITISGNDLNPERLLLRPDADIFAGNTQSYTIGDRLGSFTGILTYAGSHYGVVPTEAVTQLSDQTLTRETTALHGGTGQLSLATYNVENLDASDNKYGTLANDIVNNLGTPDVLALQEIQDADGAGNGADLSGRPTAQGLIDAISAISGAHYAYVEVAPAAPNTTGGEPGGNIRPGFLYNTDRVSYVDGSAVAIDGPAYNNTRKPLVAQFNFEGQTLTAVDVHLTARSGSDAQFGANQPPVNLGDQARTDQAAGVKAYVNNLLASNPDAHVAILGDWNGFSFEQAQTQLTDRAQGGVFTDLNTLLPAQERYSYEFDGNAQQIDHILVTGNLLPGAQYDSVHLNSEFGGDRPTDHDPQVSVLNLGNVAAAAAAPQAASFAQASPAAFAPAGEPHHPALEAAALHVHGAGPHLEQMHLVQLV